MYNFAIQELQSNNLFLEALHIAIALNEIGLLLTKEDIYQSLGNPSKAMLRTEKDTLLDTFSKRDLAVLYENSLNYDGAIMSFVSQIEYAQDNITAVITLLMLIKDI